MLPAMPASSSIPRLPPRSPHTRRSATSTHPTPSHSEYYDWSKLDPTSEDAKKTVQAYWCEQEKLNGKEIYDSRQFK